MENCIMFNYEKYRVNLSKDFVAILNRTSPKGCPFMDYTMLDLLFDWINMYGWKIPNNTTMSVTEYIKRLQTDGEAHAVVYGGAIINILERIEQTGNVMKG